MIDLKRLTEPAYRLGIERKGAAPELVDQVLALGSSHRELQLQVEDLRARSNAVSKEIGKASPEERPAKIEAAGAVKAELGEAESRFAVLSDDLRAAALQLPVPAHESVPDGGEDEGSVIATIGGTPPEPPMDHADFGRHLGWVDNELGAAVSGSRFAYLTRGAVQLEFALVQYALNKLVARGFIPVVPPVLVREQMMEDAGFFPTDRHQVYGIPEDDLYLVGTAEVPLAGMHRGDRIDPAMLPLRYCGFSSCFRREAGTYGKDTRGIFRVHQFDKVEMFIWSDPATSWDEHELLLEIEREILDDLALPYRVVNIAAGDLGSAAAKKYDCEVWLPARAPIARSPAARTISTIRHVASTPASRATRVRSSPTHSTALRYPLPACWCFSWSTTSRPTAPSLCPKFCARSAGSTASPRRRLSPGTHPVGGRTVQESVAVPRRASRRSTMRS